MSNVKGTECLTDDSSQETLQSYKDFRLRDFSLSEKYATVVGNCGLAQTIPGERLSFESSLPTTSAQYDADEPLKKDFVTSQSPYSDSEEVALSKTQWPRSYKAFRSGTTTPQTSRAKGVLLSMETDYTRAKCSNLQTLMNAFKGNSGPGVLSLPLAFLHGGLWVGLFGFFIIGAVALNSMHILSRCTEYLEERLDTPVNDYSEVVEFIFEKCAPPKLQKFSSLMRRIIDTLILVMQCGICCIYLVFVATNVKEVMDQLWSGSPSQVAYELMVFTCLVPYLMIKSLRTLAFFSSIGNFVLMVGFIIVFQCLLQDIPSYRRLPAFSSFSMLPLFVGNAVFSFEGICLIVPLRCQMKDPKAFGGSCGVLNLTMTLHAVISASMGFYGYLKFGENTAATITLNLPQGNLSVDLMFAVVVFFSIAVQFYVPFNNIWPMLEKKLKSSDLLLLESDRLLVLAQYITRFFLIFIILLVALLVPHVDLLISVVGALMGSMLTLIIPGILDIILHHFQGKLTVLGVTKDVLIIAMGVCGLVTGTYASLLEIIRTF